MSGILNLCTIEDAEDAKDMLSDSTGLPGVLGDKGGRLFEVVGDNNGGLLDILLDRTGGVSSSTDLVNGSI